MDLCRTGVIIQARNVTSAQVNIHTFIKEDVYCNCFVEIFILFMSITHPLGFIIKHKNCF